MARDDGQPNSADDIQGARRLSPTNRQSPRSCGASILSDTEDSYLGRSTMYVRDLDQPDPSDAALAQLARSVTRVAVSAATTKEHAESP